VIVLMVRNRYRIDGGEDKMWEATARLLGQKGHQLCFFTRDSRQLRGLGGKLSGFKQGIYSAEAKAEISCILESEKPDIVFVGNLYPLISPSVLVACRQHGIPVVMRCPNYRLTCPTAVHYRGQSICELCSGGHEYWCVLKNCRGNLFESLAYATRSAVARKWGFFRENVTVYVPNCEFVKRRLVRAGFAEERIIVLPNMIFLRDYASDVSGGKYVAYAGRFSPEKGVETLLAAATKSGLPVRLAGDYSAMRSLVKAAPPNAEFLGALNRDQLDEFYRNARFLVIPSRWFEPFANVTLEAMSCGLPVIASRIGGFPEIVEDGVTGFLFEPGNSEDLASKMRLLWENPGLCRDMGRAGHEKVIREYSADRYYERLMAVFTNAIGICRRSTVQGQWGGIVPPLVET
jgi:glycosyltransferase involved in cell wall biosynthesis